MLIRKPFVRGAEFRPRQRMARNFEYTRKMQNVSNERISNFSPSRKLICQQYCLDVLNNREYRGNCIVQAS